MKDLIFVFGIDIGYGVEEAYLESFKCPNLMEAITKLIEKENIDREDFEKLVLETFIDDEFIDMIMVIDPETGNELRYISAYDMPKSVDKFVELSKEIWSN